MERRKWTGKKNEWKNGIEWKKSPPGSGLTWTWPGVKTDCTVPYLHYRITVLLLVGASIMLSWKQFYGEPIQCNSDFDEDLNSFADMYCLIHSTYTVPKINPDAAAHPGVGPIRTPIDPGAVKYHRYYLWVNIVLLLLGMGFYLPKFIWKECEIGRMGMLLESFSDESLGVKEGDVSGDVAKSLTNIQHYFIAHLGFNEDYFWSHLLSSLLYLLNVSVQILFLDNFLGNELSIYGSQVFGFTNQDPEERVDAIEAIFPKVTKCTFEMYGPSGNTMRHDFVCLLPLNVIYEKILIWIWLWFLFLAVLTFLSAGFWILYLISPYFRLYLLLTPQSPRWFWPVLQSELTTGDVFLLYVLKWNLEVNLYESLLLRITLELDEIQMRRAWDQYRKDRELDDESPRIRTAASFCPA